MGAALKSSLLLACMRTSLVCFTLFTYVSVFQLLPFLSCERMVLEGSLQECKGEQGRICDGAVTKELSNSKQVCQKGRLKIQSNKKVPADAPKQGGECEWYGQLYCDGDIIVDLYSWKFLKKCGQGRMYVYGRSWQEVAQDTRFQVLLDNFLR